MHHVIILCRGKNKRKQTNHRVPPSMHEALLTEARRLVEVDQDTMAAAEMILAAVFEAQHRPQSQEQPVDGDQLASDASVFFDGLIERALNNVSCLVPSSTLPQRPSLVSLVTDGHAAVSSLAVPPRSESDRAHAVDARELLSGVFSVIGAKMRGNASPHSPSNETSDEAQGDAAAASLHDLRSILMVAPRILSIVHSALPLLFVQSARRIARTTGPVVDGATSDIVRCNVVWSLVAWMPELLKLLRGLCTLATQQDGDVQYVEASTHAEHETHHSVRDGAASSSAATTTLITPQMMEAAVLGREGLLDITTTLVKDCCTLLEHTAATSNATTGANNVLPAKRREMFFGVCHELFMTMCSLRLAPIAASLFHDGAIDVTGVEFLDGCRGDVHDGCTLTEPAATVVCAAHYYASLGSTVRHLETDVEKRHRMFNENRQRKHRMPQHEHPSKGGDAPAPSCGHAHHHGDVEDVATAEDSASHPLRAQHCATLRQLSHDVLSLCARSIAGAEEPALTPLSSPSCYLSIAAQKLLLHLHDDAIGRHHVITGGSGALQLYHVVMVWSGAVQQEMLAEATNADASRSIGRSRSSTNHKHSPRVIANRLRDKAYDTKLQYGHGTVTEDDERRMITSRMERCTRVDAAIDPLLLIASSSEDDDNDEVDEEDDVKDFSSDCTSMGLPTTIASCAALLPGALLVLFDQLAALQPALAGGDLPEWVVNGSVSLRSLTEDAGLAPIRLLIRSKSLSSVSCGLRLWAALLSALPKYSLDVPGEVRLTSLAARTHDDEKGETSGSKPQVVTVECDDLLLNSSDVLLDTSERAETTTPQPFATAAHHTATVHGNSFRTNRFASHYYLFQDILSVVVTSPSSSHRVAARSIALRKHLTWYVAPIRSKLLCQVIFTAPFGSVATALLQKLKEEIVEGYESAHCQAMTLAAAMTSNVADGAQQLSNAAPLDLEGSGKYFLNLSVLQHLLGALRQWTTRCCTRPEPAASPSTSENHPSVRIEDPPGGGQNGAAASSFVESAATALNVVYTMLQWEQRIAGGTLSSCGPAPSSSTSVLFELTPAASSPSLPTTATTTTNAVVWKAVASKPCTTRNRNRLVHSGDFLYVLQRAVCRPWAAACDAALNGGHRTAVISSLDAFSIEEMIRRIDLLVLDGER
jgi:hypothetical protein